MKRAAFAEEMLVLIFAAAASAGPPQWRYSKLDDPLHGTLFDQFVLAGTYTTPPSRATADFPALVVQCSKGRFREGSLDVGAVVEFLTYPDGQFAHRLKGVTQAEVEMRWDGKKSGVAHWEISNNGQRLFFDHYDLIQLMTGSLFGHPSVPGRLAHALYLGVEEAAGNEIVMQFGLPQDDTQIVSACRLEWGRKYLRKLPKE
ncbi:MAG: hypothetical protein ACRD3O_09885 [Terriglobia bacterium]